MERRSPRARLRRCSATPRSSRPIWGRPVLLEVRGLEVHYGGIRAVKGIDLAVNEGELVCLIGANGAGKTSTLKALCRLIASRAGTLRYRGEDIATSPVHALPRKGLVMVPEGRGIFRQLTVEENLALGAYALGGGDPEPQYASFPRLRERRKQIAGTLSGGEQQMLAIARALMSRPRLLLLDEPSMGLAPLMVERIFDVIRTIASEGVTLLLVEQNARLALEISHRGYVLEGGMVAIEGEARSLLDYRGEAQALSLLRELRDLDVRWDVEALNLANELNPIPSPARDRSIIVARIFQELEHGPASLSMATQVPALRAGLSEKQAAFRR